MENDHRLKISSSGDKFSFPALTCHTPQYSDQFEFGPVTMPCSPNSPADHLFFNGKLLPHVFPIQTGTPTQTNFSYSRSTSRTSSRSSLMSSRSNSTNSRSSTCSSARTSTSEASERNRFSSSFDGVSPGRTSTSSVRKDRNRPVLGCSYQYGTSQRWQFIAAAPVLKHQGSRSRKVDVLERKGSKKSKGVDEGSGKSVKLSFGRRILKSFVSACKECHAIKTSNNVEGVGTRGLEV